MPTHIHFVNEKTFNVAEDLDTVRHGLIEHGAALVHEVGREERSIVFSSTIVRIEEYTESGEGPLIDVA